jgi:hypothetical protein
VWLHLSAQHPWLQLSICLSVCLSFVLSASPISPIIFSSNRRERKLVPGKGKWSCWGTGALGPASWCVLPEDRASATSRWDTSLQAAGVLGSAWQHGIPVVQYSGAVGIRESSLWLFPSITPAGAMEPAYVGSPGSLAFQGEGSWSCSKGEHEAMSSCVCWEAGLPTMH